MSVWRAKLKVMEQSQTVQEQKKRLDQLLEVKAKVEKKLNTVSSDLQSQETKSREDQQQLGALRQTLDQLSDREREVREGSVWITPAKTRPTLPSIGLSVLVSKPGGALHFLSLSSPACFLCSPAFPELFSHSDLVSLCLPLPVFLYLSSAFLDFPQLALYVLTSGLQLYVNEARWVSCIWVFWLVVHQA